MIRISFFLSLLAHCALSPSAAQQMGCSASFTASQVAALIASNYAGTGQGSLPPTITLQLSPEGLSYNVVCAASSGVRDQYRFVSIVAYFTTSDANVSPPGVPIYRQFEFECVNSVWSATSSFLENTVFDRTTLTSTSAAVSANNRTDCGYCLNPIFSSPPRRADTVNHCSS